jgi:hypothetical protein
MSFLEKEKLDFQLPLIELKLEDEAISLKWEIKKKGKKWEESLEFT